MIVEADEPDELGELRNLVENTVASVMDLHEIVDSLMERLSKAERIAIDG